MRKEIIQKCLKEFQRQGIRKMTLKEIAGELGVSTKTVYKYFPDKESLVMACVDTHYEQLYQNLMVVLDKPGNPLISLFRIWIEASQLDFGTTHIFYADLNYYYPKVQDRVLKKNEDKFSKPILGLMEKAREKGLTRKEIHPAVALEACGSIYSLLTRTTGFKKFKMNPFELAENTIAVYLRGLCTSKGLRELDAHKTDISFIHKS